MNNMMGLHIHESNLIEGINSDRADKDCMLAWEELSKAKEITHSTLMKLHLMITSHQNELSADEKGNYRRIQVYVGNHTPPAAHMVPALMMQYLKEFEAMDPIEAHVRFETIHPFVDGNGRTGRMLLWWHELKLGKEPTLFEDNLKHETYYPLFRGERKL